MKALIVMAWAAIIGVALALAWDLPGGVGDKLRERRHRKARELR